MHCVCGAESGVMLLPIARPMNQSVPSAHYGILRGTTSALLRAVGWEEAACVHTLQQSALTVEVLMEQGLTPAWPRGSPCMHRGGGGHHPHHEGKRGRRSLVPRPWASRRRTYRRSRWRRQEARSTELWRSSGQLCAFLSFCFLFGYGGDEGVLLLSFVLQ